MTPIPRDLVIAYNNWTADVRRARTAYTQTCRACLHTPAEPSRALCSRCRKAYA